MPELIAVRWRNSQLYELGWKAWRQAAGVENWLTQATQREYDEEHYALQATIVGQGLLASTIQVSESLAKGLLVPYRPVVSVAGAGYLTLCVPGRERHPPVRAHFDWLGREIG